MNFALEQLQQKLKESYHTVDKQEPSYAVALILSTSQEILLIERAVREGDHYVINGTKIWTTHAHFANRIFCLVRTSTQGKPQEGITFLPLYMTPLL